jgi:hypothetical protein
MALLAALGAPVFADLNNFRDDVEKQEKDKPADPPPAAPATPAPDGSDCNTVACNAACNVCSSVDWVGLTSVWTLGNASVRYSDYPWSDSTFVQMPKTSRQDELSPLAFQPGPGKPGWYSVQAGYQMLKGMGSGADLSLRGQFNGLIGPDVDAMWITDGSQWFVASRVGLRLSVVQSDPLSVSIYGRIDVWSGVLNRNGGDFGLEWRSLPFKPVEVTARTGMQVFQKFVMADEEVRAGVCVGPLEIQGGWTWWNLFDNSNGDIAQTYQGPYLGFSFHW